MPTTSDYLESLRNDLNTIVSTLNLQEGTNFTDIKNATLNGDITAGGGGDLSEYFNVEPQSVTGTYSAPYIVNNYIKKLGELNIPNNVSTLSYMTSSSIPFNITVLPKIICGNNVTDMRYMFSGGNLATTIDLLGLNTSNVTRMDQMFYNCNKLINLNCSTFDTKKCISFAQMFAGCSLLQELDLSSFETNALQSTDRMFQSCTSLTKIDMRNFNFSNIQITNNMFGMNSGNGPADDCLIIVKDNTQKTWINSNFSRLTNVKTISEL